MNIRYNFSEVTHVKLKLFNRMQWFLGWCVTATFCSSWSPWTPQNHVNYVKIQLQPQALVLSMESCLGTPGGRYRLTWKSKEAIIFA